jgi:hypothetical protein
MFRNVDNITKIFNIPLNINKHLQDLEFDIITKLAWNQD